jgi:peptidoglycan biosynthesis protein MviN/MurJ (putative lipid II flippase)
MAIILSKVLALQRDILLTAMYGTNMEAMAFLTAYPNQIAV